MCIQGGTMKEDILLIAISIMAVVGLAILAVDALDRRIERECSDRDMKNPPEYCVEYWRVSDEN